MNDVEKLIHEITKVHSTVSQTAGSEMSGAAASVKTEDQAEGGPAASEKSDITSSPADASLQVKEEEAAGTPVPVETADQATPSADVDAVSETHTGKRSREVSGMAIDGEDDQAKKQKVEAGEGTV